MLKANAFVLSASEGAGGAVAEVESPGTAVGVPNSPVPGGTSETSALGFCISCICREGS